MKRNSFLYRNGLSITLILFMLLFWFAQFLTGWKDHNSELQEAGKPGNNRLLFEIQNLMKTPTGRQIIVIRLSLLYQ